MSFVHFCACRSLNTLAVMEAAADRKNITHDEPQNVHSSGGSGCGAAIVTLLRLSGEVGWTARASRPTRIAVLVALAGFAMFAFPGAHHGTSRPARGYATDGC